jgi:hypothetical protein
MGVEATAIANPFDTSALELLAAPPAADGAIAADTARTWGLAIDPRENGAFVAVNRLLAAGMRLERASGPLSSPDGRAMPPGAWVASPVRGAKAAPPRTLDAARRVVADLGLTGAMLSARPAGGTVPVRRARIGLYRSWVANMDEGWTRWLLERYEFPYTSLANQDIRAGSLRARFDVIVLPDQSPRQILDGHQPGARPSRPGPWNPPPPEYQGGIGDEGVVALQQFVRDGGTLVALDEASDLVLSRFGGVFSRIADVTEGLPRTAFYCPGSLLRIVVDPAAPGAFGMAPDAAANFAGSRAFATTDPAARSLAVYAPAARLLMSGWLLGADTIAGRHAALEVREGAGRVVLLAFRAQFRAQPHGTFKLLFNQLYAGG